MKSVISMSLICILSLIIIGGCSKNTEQPKTGDYQGEIAPYAMGTQKFVVPYSLLEEGLNPAYFSRSSK